MIDYPKTLILTTNRTEAGEPVYAPCWDLRELITEWRTRKMPLPGYEYADELEAALKPQGGLLVARPLVDFP